MTGRIRPRAGSFSDCHIHRFECRHCDGMGFTVGARASVRVCGVCEGTGYAAIPIYRLPARGPAVRRPTGLTRVVSLARAGGHRRTAA